jgi:hypothetical protein
MRNLVYPALGFLIALALVGGFLMLTSLGYNSAGSLIIESSRNVQFSIGITLFLMGLVGISFIVRFFAVFGKTSIFRPHTQRLAPIST